MIRMPISITVAIGNKNRLHAHGFGMLKVFGSVFNHQCVFWGISRDSKHMLKRYGSIAFFSKPQLLNADIPSADQEYPLISRHNRNQCLT